MKDKYHKEPCTSSDESVTKEDKELAGLVACITTLKDNLLFQYGTTPLPPPLKKVQTLNLKHGKPFDVMDLL